jgi:DnaJ-class molecular chaperone
MENYYVILGIPQSASPEEIKKKYLALANLHHPDKNSASPESAEYFKKIQVAYGILSDPAKRAAFDLQHKDLPETAPQAKQNDLLTEAFRSAGMWAGLGSWIVSQLKNKINRE